MTDDVTADPADEVLSKRIEKAKLALDVQHYQFYSGLSAVLAGLALTQGVRGLQDITASAEMATVLLVAGGLALMVMLVCMSDLSRSSDKLGRVTRELLVAEREEELRGRTSSIDG